MKQEQPKKKVRCAIYTRKSTDENLDMEFNSLDAQREAGEAFVASQKSEGWICMPDKYDDGGYTGGNIERPALKRLMKDIEAGQVDCIVVYKVDRLSRSLMDFASLIQVFDRHNISFVSVTQQFNTTTSMGRLTLNILLSFAQFEREIISERTRDKIAATRRKGKWSGGTPMLGYDVDPRGRRLLVNEDEAARVRGIFELYLQQESLTETIRELDARQWTTKRWNTQSGHVRGGNRFTKALLFKLLTNVIYLGKITYKDEVHAGEHPAIVDATIFERVQHLLKRNGSNGGSLVRNQFGALLKGILRCASCDCGMVHTHTTRQKNKRYRYYVCQNAQDRGWKNCPAPSVPAPEIERLVTDEIRAIGEDPSLLADTLAEVRQRTEKDITEFSAEKKALENELKKYEAEVRKLTTKIGKGECVTDQMADVQERIRNTERRATEVREQVIALNSKLVDERDVAQACSVFTPLWETLNSREQAKIVHRLVQRVDYDGVKGNVSITFHPAGIKTLAGENPNTENKKR